MQTVIEKEKTICRMLDKKDPYALQALEHLFIRFDRDDNLRPTIHPTLISAIYLERTEQERWKLSVQSNSSDTTCNRYRNRYIKFFYYFMSGRRRLPKPPRRKQNKSPPL